MRKEKPLVKLRGQWKLAQFDVAIEMGISQARVAFQRKVDRFRG